MEFPTIQRMTCPICASSKVDFLFALWDDRFGQPDTFPLKCCRACDFAFLGLATHPDSSAALYGKYYPRPNPGLRSSWYSTNLALASLGRWLDGNLNPAYTIQSGEKVLDVGCGTGEILGIARRRGATAEGLELDPKAVDEARRKGFVCYHGLVDNCVDLVAGSYDRIILNQVLEHVLNPIQTLARCRDLLFPDGKIVIAAPHLHGIMRKVFGRNWISWHAPYHLNHFSKKSLTMTAERAGLTIKNFTQRTPSNWIILQFLIGRSRRGIPNPRFRTDFPIWQRMFVFPIGRLIDFLKRGEGCLAVLVRR